jgi:predicted nucleic acid-binding protein
MYLVDTSVWIHALRPSGHPAIQAQLKPLIVNGETAVTEWILLELMTGLAKSEQPEAFLKWFVPVARLPFQSTWWEKAWHHAGKLRKQGISPSAADCFIATVAIEHEATLIHCDRDFETMKGTVPLKTLDWTQILTPS